MRVLALGAFDVPYIRDNWGDALRQVLAEDVTPVNVTAWLACAPPEAHIKAVYRLLATGAYDYLFLYHDYVFADFPEEFFAHVRSAGVRTLAFHPDDEPEVWYRRNAPFDPRYDLVASHSKRAVSRRLDEGRPTSPLYLPWGFNPRFFDRPAQPVTPQHDVVFVGKYKVHESDSTIYREDGKRRDDALCGVADLCAKNGWRFSLFGYGWERHPRLSRFAHGVLSHADMVRTFHESRIVLNPGWTADAEQVSAQTKLRHFEVPGCGAFQLTNENPELAELFEPGREIAFYGDNADLCDRIAYYLSNERERLEIADRGWRRAHRDHTLDQRVRTLLSEAGRRFPPRRSIAVERPAPRVTTLRVSNVAALAGLRARIDSDPELLAGTDAVHLLACAGHVTSTDYSALRDWWRAGAAVYVGRTFYRSAAAGRNPLQPQRTEMTGGFLAERVRLETIPFWQREPLLESLPAVTDGEQALFALNYIARKEALPGLIDALRSGTPAAVDALSPLPTGAVFTEVEVRLPSAPGCDGMSRPVPAFMAPLAMVLDQADALGQRVAIYGARGEMAEYVFAAVRRRPRTNLVGLFDRAMAGRQVDGVSVFSAFELTSVAPDLLIIAAAYSGPEIYEQLKPLEARMTIVPLYDLKASAWSVLVAA
jgi:hypothetical protein